ncbi:MAG: hypothetical protein [Bacteriophage sp.]|nr:MAG: hypothetical protein [Bacteriophage sp.]
MKTVIRIWCEWDIGNENIVFSDFDIARQWADQAIKDSGLEESMEELEQHGLIGFEQLKLIEDAK